MQLSGLHVSTWALAMVRVAKLDSTARASCLLKMVWADASNLQCVILHCHCRYLGFLVAQTTSCAWAAHAALPCLTNPHPLLPWHTLFGVDWRVAATMLLLLGLLLPFLAHLLAQQLYLAATAQTARECFRR